MFPKWETSVDEEKMVDSVFLDLKVAFETIEGTKLLFNLQYYGITDTALKWFESYLSGRKQVFRCDN